MPTAEPTAEPTAVPTAPPAAEATPVPETNAIWEHGVLSEEREIDYIEPRWLPTDDTVAGKGTSTVRVRVFDDRNLDGAAGQSEGRRVDTLVELIYRRDSGDAVVATYLTNSDSAVATFEELPAGTYLVRTTLPTGYGYTKQGKSMTSLTSSIMQLSSATVQESEPFELEADTLLEMGVGTIKAATLTGRVWVDTNSDGLMDAQEPGLAGAVVEAAGTRNGLVYQTLTDANGNYTFTQLRAGAYDLRFSVPENMAFTISTRNGNANQRSVMTGETQRVGERGVNLNLNANPDLLATNQNIGLMQACSIPVRVFMDVNYNGVYDEGEPAYQDVTVQLRKSGNDDLMGSYKSDESGMVNFVGMRPNRYTLRTVLPDDGSFYTILGEGEGANRMESTRREALLTNFSVAQGESYPIFVGVARFADIRGTAYFDNNFSGTMDEGEDAAQGVRVRLLDAEGEEVAHTTTNASGKYAFRDILPGEYRLAFTAAAGYAFTKPGEGNVAGNTQDGEGETELFLLQAGTQMEAMDAGLILPGVVEGTLYLDLNENGARDLDEPGVNGAALIVMNESGEILRVTQDGTAEYRLDAVIPGTAFLRIELPENGRFLSTEGSGFRVTEDGAAESDWFEVTAHGLTTLNTLSALVYSSLSGTFFEDTNADGVRQEGEQPLPGVSLTLTPARADLAPVYGVSGTDGAFALSDIHPDCYTLQLTLPDGLVISRSESSLPLTAGEDAVETALDLTWGVQLAGESIGLTRPAGISGRVWMDENGNGLLDDGEAGNAGLEVLLTDGAGSTVKTLTTDETGAFADSHVLPGTYSLVFTPDEETEPTLAGDTTFTLEEDGCYYLRDITVDAGDQFSAALLGLSRMGSVSGTVWHDVAGEFSPLSGAAVTLLNASGEPLASAATDDAGAYSFEKLLPGVYQLQVDMPEGEIPVRQGDERLLSSGWGHVMTSSDGRTALSDPFTLKMGVDMDNMDAGAVSPGRIGDFCWLDLNANGLQDDGEGGIPMLQLRLMQQGELVAMTQTDQYGFYVFEDLYPGVYTLSVVLPETLSPTTRREDYTGIVSLLKDDGETVSFTAVSGGHNYNVDLGFLPVVEGVYPEGYGEGEAQIWN